MISEKAKPITSDDFNREVIESEIPCLVDFWAPWCNPCQMLGPIIDELAEELAGKVKVLKINIDDEPEIASKYRVMSIPTIFLFKNGEVADKSVGMASKQSFIQMIEKHL